MPKRPKAEAAEGADREAMAGETGAAAPKKPRRRAGTRSPRASKKAAPADEARAETGTSGEPADESATRRPTAARLRVRQTRSGIGHPARYRRTLEALGLRHHQDEVVLPDNPSVRGMVRLVRELVRVRPEEA